MTTASSSTKGPFKGKKQTSVDHKAADQTNPQSDRSSRFCTKCKRGGHTIEYCKKVPGSKWEEFVKLKGSKQNKVEIVEDSNESEGPEHSLDFIPPEQSLDFIEKFKP